MYTYILYTNMENTHLDVHPTSSNYLVILCMISRWPGPGPAAPAAELLPRGAVPRGAEGAKGAKRATSQGGRRCSNVWTHDLTHPNDQMIIKIDQNFFRFFEVSVMIIVMDDINGIVTIISHDLPLHRSSKREISWLAGDAAPPTSRWRRVTRRTRRKPGRLREMRRVHKSFQVGQEDVDGS